MQQTGDLKEELDIPPSIQDETSLLSSSAQGNGEDLTAVVSILNVDDPSEFLPFGMSDWTYSSTLI